MITSKSLAEIRLYNAMEDNNLSLEECLKAIDSYANEKLLCKDLDNAHNIYEDTWDNWHDGDMK